MWYCMWGAAGGGLSIPAGWPSCVVIYHNPFIPCHILSASHRGDLEQTVSVLGLVYSREICPDLHHDDHGSALRTSGSYNLAHSCTAEHTTSTGTYPVPEIRSSEVRLILRHASTPTPAPVLTLGTSRPRTLPPVQPAGTRDTRLVLLTRSETLETRTTWMREEGENAVTGHGTSWGMVMLRGNS